jgi:hypothetical protein
MIQVFIEITGQNGHRTMIPGGPFPNKQAAYAALHAYALANYGTYLAMIQAIDAYGFIVAGAGLAGQAAVVRVDTKP